MSGAKEPAVPAGAEARLRDLEARLADIEDGLRALVALVPDHEGEPADNIALLWTAKALHRQVRDAGNVANGDTEPRAV